VTFVECAVLRNLDPRPAQSSLIGRPSPSAERYYVKACTQRRTLLAFNVCWGLSVKGCLLCSPKRTSVTATAIPLFSGHHQLRWRNNPSALSLTL
jgi:hypothetical protein